MEYDEKDYFELTDELIHQGQLDKLKELLNSLHPADVADVIERLDDEYLADTFRLLHPDIAAGVVADLEDHTLDRLLEGLSEKKLADIINRMDPDDATDLVMDLPEAKRDSILSSIGKKESEEVKELLQHDEDTAGGLMTTDLVVVNREATVEEAISVIRRAVEKIEDFFYVYVVDDNNVLVGVLPLRGLLVTRSDRKVSDIMEIDVVKVPDSMDQEEVANIARKYDFVAIPVVDEGGRLVGRVTFDDIADVIEEEATEDISKMAGTGEEEIGERSALRVAAIRLPWIAISLIGGLTSASIIGAFRDTLGRLLSLAFFIPIITAMGGNVGVQSASITVRGIAIGEITYQKLWKRILREVRVAFIMGIICGTTVGAIASSWQNNPMLGVVVGTAMFTAIAMAATMGTVVPLLFQRIGADPAIATGPFVTMSNDITGIIIYFLVASLMFKWLEG